MITAPRTPNGIRTGLPVAERMTAMATAWVKISINEWWKCEDENNNPRKDSRKINPGSLVRGKRPGRTESPLIFEKE
jgi:hypothetical protein